MKKRISITKDMNFWRRRFKNPFLLVNFRKEKSVLCLYIQWKAKLFQRENGFVRTFVWISLLVSGTFWSFYGFLLFSNDRPRSFCNLSTKIHHSKWIHFHHWLCTSILTIFAQYHFIRFIVGLDDAIWGILGVKDIFCLKLPRSYQTNFCKGVELGDYL